MQRMLGVCAGNDSVPSSRPVRYTKATARRKGRAAVPPLSPTALAEAEAKVGHGGGAKVLELEEMPASEVLSGSRCGESAWCESQNPELG